ncbi:hypothetical protein PF005_g23151 [Phytophthora fragariae]|uniref:Secreted protein n=2 Tax=Phytophthora TaxID=4783 RepID=A0A6A3WE42_9STRA|nr:hypothetical protein PF003_g10548 [Phytophthora fragariae]KAE9048639.1 hypothetical protein PR002_g348 [Phytophthora rubi]KAE8925722.1 hypothetical protein PF009_g24079 [Phytophthora fragariae]KAE8981145.1 hypothetical protein PF011_g22145 [Phytophthora fragariae]KAE9052601.1 hypothetical protein PR001_g370 [Phytophthora rubi]
MCVCPLVVFLPVGACCVYPAVSHTRVAARAAAMHNGGSRRGGPLCLKEGMQTCSGESKGVAGGTSANLASLVGQLATANEGEKEGTTLFHR